MSSSEPTDFDRWFVACYAERQGFTALILLLDISDVSVAPVSCSYLNVVGDEVDWPGMKALLDQARGPWQGVAFFVESAPGGGPVPDLAARELLQQRINEVTANRMRLNDAGLFDQYGRAFRIDPVEAG